MAWQNYWIFLTSGRSLEAKNIQKQENLLCRVKTKIKGIVRKSPDSMKNMSRTSTNYQI
jgi:hypothetical protein